MAKSQKENSFNFRVNDEIKGYNQVRIVGNEVESKVVSLGEAKAIARELELDLVEINSKGNVPILQICNYEKLIYDLKKKAKKNKQVSKPLKEIQLSVSIASNDLKTKVKKAAEFITEGSKVKVVLKFKGREMVHHDQKCLYEFITMLDDVAVPESLPKDEGNKTIVYLKKK